MQSGAGLCFAAGYCSTVRGVVAGGPAAFGSLRYASAQACAKSVLQDIASCAGADRGDTMHDAASITRKGDATANNDTLIAFLRSEQDRNGAALPGVELLLGKTRDAGDPAPLRRAV